LEEDGFDFDEEEMAMITRRFKKSSRRPKRTPRKRMSTSPEAMNTSTSWDALNVENVTTV